MHQITVETEFAAAHSLQIRGQREPIHGHNWHVTVDLCGSELDGDGLLVDFHVIERGLEAVVEPFRNRNLNEVSPFDTHNPSAEHVALYIADEMTDLLDRTDHTGVVRVRSVRVTEAPGCAATYFPEEGRGG